MNQRCGFKKNTRHGERGEGRFKLIITLVVLFLAIWAGYNYIPVAYNAQVLKQEMDTTVLQAMSNPYAVKDPVGWTTTQLKKTGTEYGVPEDALIDVKPQKGGGVQAQVKYKKPVPVLPFYTYDYEFDYTAHTSGLSTK